VTENGVLRDKTRRIQIAGGKTLANVLYVLVIEREGHPDVVMELMVGGW